MSGDGMVMNEEVYRHTHLLGTLIEVRLRGAEPAALDVVNRLVVDAIVRLQAVFSVFDEQSELSRWKRGEVDQPSAELVTVMSAAHEWQERSLGAFNPMTGLLSDVWLRAEERSSVPTAAELYEVASSIARPRFEITGGRLRRTGDCAALNLNAIAKGFIVDRASDLAMSSGDISMIVVAAGGDVLQRGAPAAKVGIENPLRPYDNEPPLTVIDLADAGLATSGAARRGVQIDGRRFSHVIDPRTGEPVDRQASISVVAPDAMTADVLATTLGMTNPAAAIDASTSFPECACLVIGVDGSRWADQTWRDRYGDPLLPTSG
ncbi:FAD:protein FMN transferase [Ilumatobacter sp.]|uniref:FAD:protein FMN transferase n=1 Tax=Ilumatobacter sp. TaxID=1967498 RepID=UPI003C571C33